MQTTYHWSPAHSKGSVKVSCHCEWDTGGLSPRGGGDDRDQTDENVSFAAKPLSSDPSSLLSAV